MFLKEFAMFQITYHFKMILKCLKWTNLLFLIQLNRSSEGRLYIVMWGLYLSRNLKLCEIYKPTEP